MNISRHLVVPSAIDDAIIRDCFEYMDICLPHHLVYFVAAKYEFQAEVANQVILSHKIFSYKYFLQECINLMMIVVVIRELDFA